MRDMRLPRVVILRHGSVIWKGPTQTISVAYRATDRGDRLLCADSATNYLPPELAEQVRNYLSRFR